MNNRIFKDDKGQLWSTCFGSEGGAPWQERTGMLPAELGGDGKVHAK